MPELPEVETVRDGLERWVLDRPISAVSVHHPRAVRRHEGADFGSLLVGTRFVGARRRGKYLWLPLDSSDALLAHLGMSGQLLVVSGDSPFEKHLRVRISFADGGQDLRFVDQRTFGGLSVEEGVAELPERIAHIALDPVDPSFDDVAFVAALRRRQSGVKRALLDQTLISGVGNIYADEALWRARLHGERVCAGLSRATVLNLLACVRSVLGEALVAGGTSFDALYVNVNGESGYFDRSLNAYGQEGLPCPRCGVAIRRTSWMNRSSFWCPRCQKPPRTA
jgi:formamidopyrimidine-DNA glycosylase